MLSLYNEYFYELKLYVSNNQWGLLLNTTKKFNNIKFNTQHITLDETESIKYLICSEFYNLINSKIFDSLNQLSINLNNCILSDDNSDNISDNNYLKIYGLNINYSNINDLSTLKYVKKLKLFGCNDIYDSDLVFLENIKDLNLSFCKNIIKLESFKNITKVVLNCCSNLIDISSLANARYIHISNCDNIIKLPKFINGILFQMISCNGNIDVSELHNIKYVQIILCNNIIGINNLILKKSKNLLIHSTDFYYMN